MDIDGAWNPEVFGAVGVISGPIETGTKLYISNLDFGVSNEDIRVCWLEQLKLCLKLVEIISFFPFIRHCSLKLGSSRGPL